MQRKHVKQHVKKSARIDSILLALMLIFSHFFIMKHNKFTIFSFSSILFLTICLCWYYFFPRICIFESEKISLFDLKKSKAEANGSYSSYYYNYRLESKLYEDAYLLTQYFWFAMCIDEGKAKKLAKGSEHILCNVRTIPCCLSENDHLIICELKDQFKQVVLEFYASGKPIIHPSNIPESIFVRAFVAYNFGLYHDFLRYDKEIDQEEFLAFALWFHARVGTNAQFKLLQDPLGWREVNFEKLRAEGHLVRFLSQTTCTELLLDKALYEKECLQFSNFLRELVSNPTNTKTSNGY